MQEKLKDELARQVDGTSKRDIIFQLKDLYYMEDPYGPEQEALFAALIERLFKLNNKPSPR